MPLRGFLTLHFAEARSATTYTERGLKEMANTRISFGRRVLVLSLVLSLTVASFGCHSGQKQRQEELSAEIRELMAELDVIADSLGALVEQVEQAESKLEQGALKQGEIVSSEEGEAFILEGRILYLSQLESDITLLQADVAELEARRNALEPELTEFALQVADANSGDFSLDDLWFRFNQRLALTKKELEILEVSLAERLRVLEQELDRIQRPRPRWNRDAGKHALACWQSSTQGSKGEAYAQS